VAVLFIVILGPRLTGQGLPSLIASATTARVFAEERTRALSVSGRGHAMCLWHAAASSRVVRRATSVTGIRLRKRVLQNSKAPGTGPDENHKFGQSGPQSEKNELTDFANWLNSFPQW
jgi:hypothetical protein